MNPERWLDPETGLVGVSPAIRRAATLIRVFAQSPLSVLIVGPTGAGKEMVARALHSLSRRSGNLIDVNCAAVPRELVEGMLFGHRRGAFTHATTDSEGLIAAADKGTLFLDELSSMALEAQGKLLRVLEAGEVRRVGDSMNRKVDFRALAAVQETGRSLVEAGRLREDLVQRLSGIVIELPALRERAEDIGPLANHFAAGHRRVVTSCGIRALQAHSWPGNVRELRAVIDRAVVLAEGVLDKTALEASLELGGVVQLSGVPLQPADASERTRWVELLNLHDWRADRVAETLGLSRATVFRRLKALRISLRARGPLTPGNGSRSVA